MLNIFGKKKDPVPVKESNPAPAMNKNPEADAWLLEAAVMGNAEEIKHCLRLGADPNVRKPFDQDRKNDDAGMTPLMLACWSGPDMLEGVKALLDAGADVHLKTPNGYNAILGAANGCSRYTQYAKDGGPLIDAIMNAGAKADDGFANGKTPLFLTINEYDALISPSAVKALLKHGANPNATITDYSDLLTTMCWTTQQKYGEDFNLCMEAVKAVVEAGANVNPTTKPVRHLTSCPIGAAANGSHELTQYLLSKGANPDVVDVNGVSLLEKTRRRLNEILEGGYKTDNIMAIIDSLEQALMKQPDGKGQGGTAEHINPPTSQRSV